MSSVINKNLDFQAIRQATKSGIASLEDLVRGDILGHLCGQFEPHGNFVTRNHEYVVIDNECMFAGSPCLNQCHWLDCGGSRPLIGEVCRGFADLCNEELRAISALPDGFRVANGRDLYSDLLSAKAAAIEYIDLFDGSVR